MSGSVQANVSHEKMHALIKPKVQQKGHEQQHNENIIKQEPSAATATQWAYQMQATDKTGDTNLDARKAKAKGNLEIVAPDEGDLAVLSSLVGTNDTSVVSLKERTGFKLAKRAGIDTAALLQSYKDTYRKTKSHNLLMERFFSSVKFQALKTVCSALGMTGADQMRIQAEVRQEALAEIHTKLSNDWAHAVALTEVVG
jgi:hypothetical protein